MLKRTALLASLLLPFSAHPTSAACPVNGATSGNPGGYFEFSSSAPTWNQGIPCGVAAYDLRVGTFSLSGGGGGGEQSCSNGMGVADIYQLIGPASAVPLPIGVHLHVVGDLPASQFVYPYIGLVCNAVSASATLTSGANTDNFSASSGYSPCAAATYDDHVDLQLSHLPNEPFQLNLNFGVGGNASGGTVNGVLTFDLPEGYTLTSCQGWGTNPTPTITRSWGSLKHSYR